jgi:hypothetical protein
MNNERISCYGIYLEQYKEIEYKLNYTIEELAKYRVKIREKVEMRVEIINARFGLHLTRGQVLTASSTQLANYLKKYGVDEVEIKWLQKQGADYQVVMARKAACEAKLVRNKESQMTESEFGFLFKEHNRQKLDEIIQTGGRYNLHANIGYLQIRRYHVDRTKPKVDVVATKRLMKEIYAETGVKPNFVDKMVYHDVDVRYSIMWNRHDSIRFGMPYALFRFKYTQSTNSVMTKIYNWVNANPEQTVKYEWGNSQPQTQ